MNISTRVLMMAHETESKLKYNTQNYVTKPSYRIIIGIIRRFSSPKIPIHDIGSFMTLITNAEYQNVAISTLLCKLFYLRIFRYNFRLIKKQKHHFSDLIGLMLVGDTLLGDLFIEAVKAYFTDHQQFMDIMFGIKARASFAEQLDLQQIQWRYWNHHHARLNDHRVYKEWW